MPFLPCLYVLLARCKKPADSFNIGYRYVFFFLLPYSRSLEMRWAVMILYTQYIYIHVYYLYIYIYILCTEITTRSIRKSPSHAYKQVVYRSLASWHHTNPQRILQRANLRSGIYIYNHTRWLLCSQRGSRYYSVHNVRLPSRGLVVVASVAFVSVIDSSSTIGLDESEMKSHGSIRCTHSTLLYYLYRSVFCCDYILLIYLFTYFLKYIMFRMK